MPRAIPARHLVIEIADFHNKIDPKRTRGSAIAEAAFGSKADMGGQSRRVRYPTSLKESSE